MTRRSRNAWTRVDGADIFPAEHCISTKSFTISRACVVLLKYECHPKWKVMVSARPQVILRGP